jgi:tripartite-type tricarboxylate transporter receptor subunit TctC
MRSIRVARCVLLALGAIAFDAASQVDDYPTRPVRMVLPFPPGGSTDRIGRLVAEKMSISLRQPVVVDYRPGAGGNIGIGAVAKANADGYSILLSSSTISVSPSMYKKLEYDTLRDLAPIGLAARIPTVVCVHPSVPARTLKELVAIARGHPGQQC